MFRVFARTMCTSKNTNTHTSLKHRPPLSVFGITGRYVSALYSAAHEKQELELVEQNLKSISKILEKPKIKDFLETSLLSRNEKAKLLYDIGKESGLAGTATNFLVIVAENGRLKMLKRMITQFSAIMVAHRNEALCEVISAEPLSRSDRNALIAVLKKLVKGKNITLTEKVDSSIIGGVIVGVEDRHIDLSISRRINMYTELLKQAI